MSVSFMITAPERFWKPEILVNFLDAIKFIQEMNSPSVGHLPTLEIFILEVLTHRSFKERNEEMFTLWFGVRKMELRALTENT